MTVRGLEICSKKSYRSRSSHMRHTSVLFFKFWISLVVEIQTWMRSGTYLWGVSSRRVSPVGTARPPAHILLVWKRLPPTAFPASTRKSYVHSMMKGLPWTGVSTETGVDPKDPLITLSSRGCVTPNPRTEQWEERFNLQGRTELRGGGKDRTHSHLNKTANTYQFMSSHCQEDKAKDGPWPCEPDN